ncbi:Crp/Fnr family transcriptional regulator [Desertivirga arenae]|uniref:Crp/Fnr family transcriptional regulator n=1 Tax=Desertivirga arenae TaxID=2810309 RepID=UPI001A95B528|nr:Crp/Fnr family transcriptional regulator [Pedobacter sp. SYSU D00823]
MIKNIIKGIKQYYPVSDDSINVLAQYFTKQQLPKNHLLTKPGVRDNYVYFIEQGCSRTFLFIDGKEVTNWFSKEGDVTFSSNSLYHRTAGFEYIQLLEDSLIYRLSIETLNKLYSENIEIVNWSRVIHQEVLLKMQTLRLDRLSLSAKDRYEKFLSENPDLFNRVNLGFIASYLGMTQPHLSALRAEMRF